MHVCEKFSHQMKLWAAWPTQDGADGHGHGQRNVGWGHKSKGWIDSRKFIKYSAKAKVLQFFFLSPLCRLTMCGVVVKYVGHINEIFVKPALRHSSLPRSLSFSLLHWLASHAFKLLCAFALFRLSNAINFDSNWIFVCLQCRIKLRGCSYLENSIYFHSSDARLCDFDCVQSAEFPLV